MTKKQAYEWIENNFFGDLTEKEMKENLKAMVDKIYNSFIKETKQLSIIQDEIWMEKQAFLNSESKLKRLEIKKESKFLQLLDFTELQND